MKETLIAGLIGCQAFVVLFVALHDWISLGKLNNVAAARAVDSTRKLFLVTLLSTAPFAVGLAASVYYATSRFPNWLWWWLWISYGLAVYGMLRAWWVPYLVRADSVRAQRYQRRFAQTHAFLPARNGIRPDTLHVCLHAVVLAIVVMLAMLTLGKFSSSM